MLTATIDTGTTNTRVTLWRDRVAVAQAARPVGVRNTALTGSRNALQVGVREALMAALQQAGTPETGLGLVLASGMISANVGLHEVPHLPAPAGRAELAAGMVSAAIAEVCTLPVWFIPGVRNRTSDIGLDEIDLVDMMRGEETETIGLVDRLAISRPAVVVLPGSHTKFVQLDAGQRITGCATTLAGELLQVISQHTLLAGSLDSGFASELAPRALLTGARAAGRVGLGRACFSVRALELFTDQDRNARANFLLGAVLGADLLALRHSRAIGVDSGVDIFVAGSPLWRDAFCLLLRDDGFFQREIVAVDAAQQLHLAGAGAIAIAQARGLLPPV